MASSSSIPIPKNTETPERCTSTQHFIDRLAEELRASGGVDLPHSYFVAQVKIRLAGRDLSDRDAANDAELLIRSWKAKVAPSVFNAWARRD